MTRVASLAQQQVITSAALRTQRNVNDLQVQIASGKHTQRFSGVAENAGRLVNLKSDLKQAEQFIENIIITEKRLDLMTFAMDQIEKVARKARTDLAGAMNGSAASKLQIPELMEVQRHHRREPQGCPAGTCWFPEGRALRLLYLRCLDSETTP